MTKQQQHEQIQKHIDAMQYLLDTSAIEFLRNEVADMMDLLDIMVEAYYKSAEAGTPKA